MRSHILWQKRCATQNSFAYYAASIHWFPEHSLSCAVEKERSCWFDFGVHHETASWTSLVGSPDTAAVYGKVWPQPLDLEHSQQCPHQPEVTSRQCSIFQHTSIEVIAKWAEVLPGSISNDQSVEKVLQHFRNHTNTPQSPSLSDQDKNFSLFPYPGKQHTKRWGSRGKYTTFSTLL